MTVDVQYPNPQFKIKEVAGKEYIFDEIRKKYVQLTPEEWVRQNFLNYLIIVKQYPKGFISVEKQIKVNGLVKRYDIVIYSLDRRPWMLIECKAANVPITEHTLHQLLNYQSVIQCNHWVLTNGLATYYAQFDNALYSWLSDLPVYNS